MASKDTRNVDSNVPGHKKTAFRILDVNLKRVSPVESNSHWQSV